MTNNGNSNDKKIKCTDLSYLIGITRYDHKMMMEMITLYLDQTPALVSNMRTGLQDKDWKALNAAAHKLIPSFSIMGIDKQYEMMARELNNYNGDPLKAREIENLVLQLENTCTQACEELKEEYSILKNTKA